ncbi:MAG: YbeD family protein [Thioalkalivibrionaceae bacterium]
MSDEAASRNRNAISDQSTEARETLIEFPLDFPIKVICDAHPEAVEVVAGIAREAVLDSAHLAVDTRPSRNGRYVGVTLTVFVGSQEQLDGLYVALGACRHVKMVL